MLYPYQLEAYYEAKIEHLEKSHSELEAERDRLKAENEGLKGEILLSTVPLHEHQELRARHAALVDAGKAALHSMENLCDHYKDHGTEIDKLKAALAEVKG